MTAQNESGPSLFGLTDGDAASRLLTVKSWIRCSIQAHQRRWRIGRGLGGDLRVLVLDVSPIGLQAAVDGAHWPNDEPLEVVFALLLDELDGKAGGKDPNDAANTGADRKRRADLERDLGGNANAVHRHIDHETFMNGAVGKRQRGVRLRRDDARRCPLLDGFSGFLLLLFKPDQLVRNPLAGGVSDIEFEQ